MGGSDVTDAEKVERWRYDQARDLGYPPDDSWIIAKTATLDLRRLEALIAAGCDSTTALEILR